MRFCHLSLCLAVLLLFGCQNFPESPASDNLRTCTVVGCGFSLQVELAGSLPPDFILSAAGSTGESASVHCVNGTLVYDAATFGSSGMCSQSRVTFLGFAPEQATLTVQWDGGQVSQSFQPDYETFRPNGPLCEPECQTTTIIFVIPD